MSPLVTLTTDFGNGSPYVAAMKGVILSINPAAPLIDLSHDIPPQDLRHAAFFLAASLPYFPAGTIHVIVVDPGVGTERALLCVSAGDHYLLVPDNGCWEMAAEKLGTPLTVRKIAEPRFWRQPVSTTFHGRDILAPVAAWLSLGTRGEELGPTVGEWVRLELPKPTVEGRIIRGEVVFVDSFGNLLTNIAGKVHEQLLSGAARLSVAGCAILQQVRTYGMARPGELVSLVSSSEMLEIAVNQGSAARLLAAGVGTPVTIEGVQKPA